MMTADDDTEYTGPRTQQEWNTWAKAHDRPMWNWTDVWSDHE
jgi:hypothetical protein